MSHGPFLVSFDKTLRIFVCQAERKVMKAERALSKVEAFLKPAEQQADPNSLTDEERFMFRKLGLRMKAFLLLGKTLYLSNLSRFFLQSMQSVRERERESNIYGDVISLFR